MKPIYQPVGTSPSSDATDSSMEMQIYPSVSIAPSNEEAVGSEPSTTAPSDTEQEERTADTTPLQPPTDLEAGLTAADTDSLEPCSDCTGCTFDCSGCTFTRCVGILILALLVLLCKYTLSHIAILFLTWFFTITSVNLIYYTSVICYMIDTLFTIVVVCYTHSEIEDGKLVMPGSGEEVVGLVWDHAWFALGGGPLLVFVALPVVAGFVVWGVLMWCLSVLGWVFRSLGLL
ncbi:hypothetical protein MBLNU457_4016t1 [Dothideomycetes sp. NU457]